MATNKKNVIVGAARFYVGPIYDAADTATHPPDPVGPVTGPPAVPAESYIETLDGETDWREIGFTTDGLEVSYEPEYGDVEVDQLLDSARTFMTGMRVMLNTTFAEATLENILVVWSQDEDTLTTTGTGNAAVSELVLQGGFLGMTPVERQVIAVGNGPEQTGANSGKYAERTYWGKRALSTDTSAHSLRRAEATVLPVSFRLLPTDETGNPYGLVRERVRSW